MKIPFKKLNFTGAREIINKLLESGYIGLGEKVFEFEEELAKYLGYKYVIATDSCTSALFICLKYFHNKEIIQIPSMMVPLVANAISESGNHIEFNSDIAWVGSSYTFINTNIVDSAHQLEKNMCNLYPPEINLCFSFYPTKPIGSADGGAIATNDKDFAEWARSMITYGRNQTQKYQNSWDYDTKRIGYKRHWTNLQAVIALEQLKRLDETNELRNRVRNKYNDAFNLSNRSLYLYRINVNRRNDFIKYMAEDGIECGVHFKPLHQMKAYSHIPFEGEVMGKVDLAYEKTVSLPFYESLTEQEQDLIIYKVKKWGRIW